MSKALCTNSFASFAVYFRAESLYLKNTLPRGSGFVLKLPASFLHDKIT